jgi:3-oxoacyl-[acyl-carrier protein] reductase
MDLGLKNKNVLITGSTKGIGYAVAEVFAQEGANPVINGRNENEVAEAVESLKKYGVRPIGIAADLTQNSEVYRLLSEIPFELDVLVNNAGIWKKSLIREMTEEQFRETFAVNIEAPFVLCREFVNRLIAKNRKGKIVNITSQAAFAGSTTGHAHYAASKGALVSFSISLAREMAPFGINVNCVAPGSVSTPMLHSAGKDNVGYYAKRVPIGRLAQPVEIAYSIVFLASNKSDYYTGLTFDATGGMLMR